MKKLATAIAAIALIATPALAADIARKMPVKAPPPPPAAPVYNWSGFYIGGNGGYGWGRRNVTFTPNDPLIFDNTCGLLGGTCAPPTSIEAKGGLGGLQGGYNWQFRQNWLVGVEADFDWAHIHGAGISNFF